MKKETKKNYIHTNTSAKVIVEVIYLRQVLNERQ